MNEFLSQLKQMNQLMMENLINESNHNQKKNQFEKELSESQEALRKLIKNQLTFTNQLSSSDLKSEILKMMK